MSLFARAQEERVQAPRISVILARCFMGAWTKYGTGGTQSKDGSQKKAVRIAPNRGRFPDGRSLLCLRLAQFRDFLEYGALALSHDLPIHADEFVVGNASREVVPKAAALQVVLHHGGPGKPFLCRPRFCGLLVIVQTHVDHLDAGMIGNLFLVLLHQLWSRIAAGRSPARGEVDEVILRGLLKLKIGELLALKSGKDALLRQGFPDLLLFQGGFHINGVGCVRGRLAVFFKEGPVRLGKFLGSEGDRAAVPVDDGDRVVFLVEGLQFALKGIFPVGAGPCPGGDRADSEERHDSNMEEMF